jgi:hypothetical protein
MTSERTKPEHLMGGRVRAAKEEKFAKENS